MISRWSRWWTEDHWGRRKPWSMGISFQGYLSPEVWNKIRWWHFCSDGTGCRHGDSGDGLILHLFNRFRKKNPHECNALGLHYNLAEWTNAQKSCLTLPLMSHCVAHGTCQCCLFQCTRRPPAALKEDAILTSELRQFVGLWFIFIGQVIVHPVERSPSPANDLIALCKFY